MVWCSSGVGNDWTVPVVASFPVVFLCRADQHLSVRMCDYDQLIPSTVTEQHFRDNKVGVGASYYILYNSPLSLSLSNIFW